MWLMVIALIVAVAAWWFLRNRNAETNAGAPEHPQIPEAPNHGDNSPVSEEFHQSVFERLIEISQLQ